MATTGSTLLDFGAAPGTNVATVDVTGQTGILGSSNVECWIQGSDHSDDHNAYEHALAPQLFSVLPTTITPGVGFTIQGTSLTQRISGNWSVRWVWI